MLGAVVAVYQMVIIFLLPFLVMSSSYYKVIRTLWESNRTMTDLTNTNQVFRKGSEEDDMVPRNPSQGFVEAHYRIYPLRILSTYLQVLKFKIKRTLEFLSK